jgi:hypothetical protein
MVFSGIFLPFETFYVTLNFTYNMFYNLTTIYMYIYTSNFTQL